MEWSKTPEKALTIKQTIENVNAKAVGVGKPGADEDKQNKVRERVEEKEIEEVHTTK